MMVCSKATMCNFNVHSMGHAIPVAQGILLSCGQHYLQGQQQILFLPAMHGKVRFSEESLISTIQTATKLSLLLLGCDLLLSVRQIGQDISPEDGPRKTFLMSVPLKDRKFTARRSVPTRSCY